MKKNIFSIFAAVIFTSVLVACGGGGGGSSTTPIPTPTTVTVTCPNGTSKTAATLDLATAQCAAPAMLSISPANGVTSVSVDTFASIDVTTDSTIDLSSITSANITLKAGLNTVAGAVSVVGTKAFKFTPAAKLNYGQTFTFTAAVKDSLGRTLSVNSTFTTAFVSCVLPQLPNSTGDACIAPVTITCPNGSSQTAATIDLARAQCAAPSVLSISPANAATSVSVETFTGVNVVTDSTLDASSITTANITLKAGANTVVGSASAVGTFAFKFLPTAKLNYGQAYTFTATVKDTLGRTLLVGGTFTTSSLSCVPPQVPNSTGDACLSPVTITCPNGSSQTAATANSANAQCAAPVVLSISPASGATAVSVDSFASIDVTTDSTLDVSSITSANITLKAGLNAVAGTASATGTKAFKFTPSGKLNYGQAYTFTATVKDTLGKTLSTSSTFTTAKISCVAPQIPNKNGDACETPVVTLFASSPQLLPDLRAKYDSLCGNNVSVANALSANLTGHKDGKKDLVFNLVCGQIPPGLVTAAPTVNGVVAFIQQADGSFIDGTKALFGVDMVDLIGVGNQAVVYDFNNDGYEDIVFAVTGEDGRALPQGSTSNNRQNVFITSIGNGAYKVERLGWFSYNFHIQLVDNELGGKDVITEPIGYGGKPGAYRYKNGWTEIAGYEWVSFMATFFKERKLNEGSTVAITQSRTNGALDLFTRTPNSSWAKNSTWGFPNVTTAPWLGWNGDTGTATVMTFGGKDYVSITFEQGCELKRKPSDEPIALIVLNTNEIVGGYKGGVIVESSATLKPVTKLMAFSISNNSLSNIDITLSNEATAIQFYRIACGDVNSDGYDDIVVMPWGRSALPIIYINDGLGNFNLVDTTKLPIPSTEFTDSTMIYTDIDGDGNRDLLYWPLTKLNGNPTNVRYQLYKGQRNISAFDMK